MVLCYTILVCFFFFLSWLLLILFPTIMDSGGIDGYDLSV